MAIVVLAIIVASVMAGALLATWNFRVLCLLPAIGLIAIAPPIGFVERAGLGTIALQIIAVIVAPQLSYLATFLSARLIFWPRVLYRVRPAHASRQSVIVDAVKCTVQARDGVASRSVV
jgi:hypothetical protein